MQEGAKFDLYQSGARAADSFVAYVNTFSAGDAILLFTGKTESN